MRMRIFTTEDVKTLLSQLKDEYGIHGLTERSGVSRAYIYDVLNGKRLPGPKILAHLGMEKITETAVITYRHKAKRRAA